MKFTIQQRSRYIFLGAFFYAMLSGRVSTAFDADVKAFASAASAFNVNPGATLDASTGTLGNLLLLSEKLAGDYYRAFSYADWTNPSVVKTGGNFSAMGIALGQLRMGYYAGRQSQITASVTTPKSASDQAVVNVVNRLGAQTTAWGKTYPGSIPPGVPLDLPPSASRIALRVCLSAGTSKFVRIVTGPDGSFLIADGVDPIDPSAQFILNQDYWFIGLSTKQNQGSFVQIANQSSDATWRTSYAKAVTRATLAPLSSFGYGTDPAFRLSFRAFAPSSQTNSTSSDKASSPITAGLTGSWYTLVSEGLGFSLASTPAGFLVVDPNDFFIRAFSIGLDQNTNNVVLTPNLAAQATPFSIMLITAIHDALTAQRELWATCIDSSGNVNTGNLKKCVDGYQAILLKNIIRTTDDFQFFAKDIKSFLTLFQVNATAWAALMSTAGQAFNAIAAQMSSSASSTIESSKIAAISSMLQSGYAPMGGLKVTCFDGSPVLSGASVIIGLGNDLMMTMDVQGSLKSVPLDWTDVNSQFKITIDQTGSALFQHIASGKYITAGQLPAVVSTWLPSAVLNGTKTGVGTDGTIAAAKFTLFPGSDQTMCQFYNNESTGYIVVGSSEGYARAYNTAPVSGQPLTPNPNTAATSFKLYPIDSLTQGLVAARGLTDPVAQIQAYQNLISQILTIDNVGRYLGELNRFIGSCQQTINAASWMMIKPTLFALFDQLNQISAVSSFSTSSFSYASIQSAAKNFSGVTATSSMPAGINVGDVITLQLPAPSGIFTTPSMFQVDDSGALYVGVGADKYLDKRSWFTVVEKTYQGGSGAPIKVYGLQSLYNSNYLRFALLANKDVAAIVEQNTRAFFSSKEFNGSDVSTNFILKPILNQQSYFPEGMNVFALENEFLLSGTQVYLGCDNLTLTGTQYGRFFTQDTNQMYTVLHTASTAGSFGVTKVSSFSQALAVLRNEANDDTRIKKYSAALQNMVSLADLQMLLVELSSYINENKSDPAVFNRFKLSAPSLKVLLNSINTTMASSLGASALNQSVLPVKLLVMLDHVLQDGFSGFVSNVSFADAVTALSSTFLKIVDSSGVDNFMALLSAMYGVRYGATADDIVKLQGLISQALVHTQFKNYVGVANGNANAVNKALTNYAKKFAVPVVFDDVAAALTLLYQSASKWQTQDKNRFVSLAQQAQAQLATSSAAARGTIALQILEIANTYFLDNLGPLSAIAQSLQNYVPPVLADITFSAAVTNLNTMLDALLSPATPSSGVASGADTITNQVISFVLGVANQTPPIRGVSDLVSNRYKAFDVDFAALGQLIDRALVHPVLKGMGPVDWTNSGSATGQKNPIDYLTDLKTAYAQPIDFSTLQTYLAQALQSQASLAASDITYFMSKATYLFGLRTNIASRVSIQSLIDLFTTAMNYQLRSQQQTLQSMISSLQLYLQGLPVSTDQTFQDQFNALQNQFSVLQSNASAIKKADADNFYAALALLVKNKIQSTPSQKTALLRMLQSTAFQGSRVVFLSDNTMSALKDFIATLQVPEGFTDRYNYLNTLLRQNYSFSKNMQTDFIEIVRDWVSNDSRLKGLSEGFQTVNAQNLLLYAQNNQFKGMLDTVYNSALTGDNPIFSQAINDLNAAVSITSSSLTFSIQLATAVNKLSTPLTPDQASYLVNMVVGLVAIRIQATQKELGVLQTLLTGVQWNSVVQAQDAANPDLKLVSQLVAAANQLQQPIDIGTRLTYLEGLVAVPAGSATDQLSNVAGQNQFLEQMGLLAAQCTPAVTTLDQATRAWIIAQKASYNQLKNRTEVQQYVTSFAQLKTTQAQTKDLTYKQSLSVVNNGLPQVTADSANTYLASLVDLVNRRFEADSSDTATLTQLLASAQWNDFIGGVKQNPTDTVTIVSALSTQLASPIFYKDRLADLQAMFGLSQPLSAVKQAAFLFKLNQVWADRNNADLPDDITASIALVGKALNNSQFSSLQSSLTQLMKNFTDYQNAYVAQGGASFADLLSRVSARLPNLVALEVESYMNDLEKLVQDSVRATATDADIASFTKLVTAVTYNDVVVSVSAQGANGVNSGAQLVKLNSTTTPLARAQKILTTLATPVSYDGIYGAMVSILNMQKITAAYVTNFMNHLGKLAGMFSSATLQQLQNTKALALRALYKQEFSAQQTQLNTISTGIDQAIGANSTTFIRFVDQLKAFQIMSVSNADEANNVLKAAQQLLTNRIQAVGTDLTAFATYLSSTAFANNFVFYPAVAQQISSTITARINDPFSYTSRVGYFTTLVQKYSQLGVYASSQAGTASVNAVWCVSDMLDYVTILQNERGNSAAEGFDLSGLVKLLQFIIDKRLNTTNDPQGAASARIKSVINALINDPNPAPIRLRFAEELVNLQAELAGLTKATISAFSAHINRLVANKVDATRAQIIQLQGILTGSALQQNQLLFFDPLKNQCLTYAAQLGAPPAYSAFFNNVQQIVQQYPSFTDSNILTEFKEKAQMLVERRGQGVAENFDISKVSALFTFALNNQFGGSDSDLQNYLKIITTSAPSQDSPLAIVQSTFAQGILGLQSLFTLTLTGTAQDFQTFSTALTALVGNIADATTADVKALSTWLSSDSVTKNNVIFFSPSNQQQLSNLISQIGVPITFAQRVANLTSFIKSHPTILSTSPTYASNLSSYATDKSLFFSKVDQLIAQRGDAATEGLSISSVVALLQYAKANTFKGDMQSGAAIDNKIMLLQLPADSGQVVAYTSYADKIIALKNDFDAIGSTSGDVAKLTQFIANLNGLVDCRVDGTAQDILGLVTFITDKVSFHQLVYKQPTYTQQLQVIITSLNAPITYQHLVDNFGALVRVAIYTDQHKAAFISKLQVLSSRRGELGSSSATVASLLQDIQFVQVNKFKDDIADDQAKKGFNPPGRNANILAIETAVNSLKLPAISSTTDMIIKGIGELNNYTVDQLSAVGDAQRGSWLTQLRNLLYNLCGVDPAGNLVAAPLTQELIINVQNMVALLILSNGTIFKGGTDKTISNQVFAYQQQLATLYPTYAGQVWKGLTLSQARSLTKEMFVSNPSVVASMANASISSLSSSVSTGTTLGLVATTTTTTTTN